jgi:hypothetical protein
MTTPRKTLTKTIVAILVILSSFTFTNRSSAENLYTIQPCLSNNISIMRNNDDSSIEQPTVVTSGYRTDQGHPADERGLLRFDLSALPEGYHVRTATLSLYVIGVYTWDGKYWKNEPELFRTIELHAITSDWMGWSFTYWNYATFPKREWNTPGADFASSTDSVNWQKPGTWNNWTVTRDVEAWYEGKKPNYGWLLKDSHEGDKIGCRVEYMNWFYYYDVSYSPKLEIVLEPLQEISFPDLKLVVPAILALTVGILAIYYRKRLWYKRHRNAIT